MSEDKATVEQLLDDAQATLVKYQHMLEQGARDMSIVYAMCEHFITQCIERSDTDTIRQAIRWALDDTGVRSSDVRDFLETSCLTDPNYVTCEYDVTITVPVTITLSVEAVSNDAAEDEALNVAMCNGLESYYNDVDWYSAEIFNVEEC